MVVSESENQKNFRWPTSNHIEAALGGPARPGAMLSTGWLQSVAVPGGQLPPARFHLPLATQPHRSRSKQGCVAVATLTNGAGGHHAREQDRLHPRQHNLASHGRNSVVLTG